MTIMSTDIFSNDASLLDIADLIRGVSYQREEARNLPGAGLVPILRANNITATGLNFLDLVYVPEYRVSADQHIRKGDIILAMSSGSRDVVGKAAIAREDWMGGFGAFCGVLRTRPGMDPVYLERFFQSADYRRQIDAIATGTNINNLSKSTLKGIRLPVAPYEIQVALAELLENIEKTRQSSLVHLAAARHAIKRFRQSVLAAACSSRLTMNWREQHEDILPANKIIKLIEQKRQAHLGQRYRSQANPQLGDELPASWCWATVGALVDVATGATPLRKHSDYYGGTIPWVTSGAVNAGLITDATEYITEQAIRETNAKVFPPGTLLVAMYGEGQTRGRVAELGIAAATNQAVAALLFNEDNKFIRPYLKIFFLENYERIRMQSFGGVQPNLSLGVIRDTPLPLPPENEQKEIVQRVDALLKLAADLEQRINTAMRRIERSSQAVLAKAFRGALSETVSEEQNVELVV